MYFYLCGYIATIVANPYMKQVSYVVSVECFPILKLHADESFS